MSRCATCRWWGPQPGAVKDAASFPPDMQACALFDDGTDYIPGGAYVEETNGNARTSLIVHADFGCVLHEEK